jgi:L-alanine-DL-glutamate epimerase-like enolase superfamily enzyme
VRIVSIESRVEVFELTRPYSIAFQDTDSVDNVILTLTSSSGLTGFGAGSPAPEVTGETTAACLEAVSEVDWLRGEDFRALPRLCRELSRRLPDAPAARAALDMALHDLLAQHLGVPLVEMLGRAHQSLPTSITIGIKPVAETLEEAREYLGRGFRTLKVKIGRSLPEDLERLARLRETVGSGIGIRADANRGYTPEETRRFFEETSGLDLEFLEQPVSPRLFPELSDHLSSDEIGRIAADESLLDEADALALVNPPRRCGVFNIKLMKCGGIRSGLRIAALAETAGIDLMWGCMDESAISIAAALHAALSSPATRYLDLDGSLDLARDVVGGGFELEAGCLRTTAAPGLGVRPKD